MAEPRRDSDENPIPHDTAVGAALVDLCNMGWEVTANYRDDKATVCVRKDPCIKLFTAVFHEQAMVAAYLWAKSAKTEVTETPELETEGDTS